MQENQLQLLTNSRRSSFNDCPRKHQYRYELGYVPISTSDALRFGTMMHSLLEVWWKHLNTDPEEQMVHVDLALDKLDGNPDNDPFEIKKAECLIYGYHAQYQETRKQYKTIAVETEYKAPLFNPTTGGTSRTFEIAGKIDAIAEDSFGKLLIVEHKTTSEDISPESDYWPRLSIDGQVSGYYIGAEATGYQVGYCLYDVIEKPKLRPYKATPIDDRKYKKDGTLYANCREADETVEEFGSRLSLDIAERPNHYFARREIVRMQEEMVDYLFDMWACAREIREAQLANRWPRNPNACKRYGMCEYFPVCTKTASLDDSTYCKTEIHNELLISKL